MLNIKEICIGEGYLFMSECLLDDILINKTNLNILIELKFIACKDKPTITKRETAKIFTDFSH